MIKKNIKVYNYYYFLLFSINGVLLNYIVFKSFSVLFLIIVNIFLIYLLSCILIKKIIFTEDSILIFCPTRFFKRKKFFHYEDINLIKHQNSIYAIEWRIHLFNSKKYFFTTSIIEENKIFNFLKSKNLSIKSSHPNYNSGIFKNDS